MIPNLTWESGEFTTWDAAASIPDSSWDLATLVDTDNLHIRLVESSGYAILLVSSDTLKITLAEIPVISAVIVASDQLRVRLAESSGIGLFFASSDTLKVQLAESRLLQVNATASDVLMLSLQENPFIFGVTEAVDQLNVQLGETLGEIFISLHLFEQLRLSLLEQVEVARSVGASDVLAVHLSEVQVRCIDDWPDSVVGSPTPLWLSGTSKKDIWTQVVPQGSDWTETPSFPLEDEGCKP